MANINITALRDALHATGMTTAQQENVLRQARATPTQGAWHHVLRPLIDSIRTTKGGLKRARPSRQAAYAAYLALMEKTHANITYAQCTYTTQEAAAKAAAQTNAARLAEGKRPLGACTSHWSTWVPPHIVEATLQAFETVYAAETAANLTPGRRIHPFTTLTQRGATQTKWRALLHQAQPHINAGFEIDPAYVEAHTRGMPHERAEYIARAMARLHKERYRAAYAARKTIQQRMQGAVTDLIVPLHWTHVLDDDTRSHLRAAERAAGGDGYTRDIGIFDNGQLVPPAAPIPTDDPEHTPGYVAPRPPDRFTKMSEETAREKARLDVFYAKVREQGDEEMARRIAEGDL